MVFSSASHRLLTNPLYIGNVVGLLPEKWSGLTAERVNKFETPAGCI